MKKEKVKNVKIQSCTTLILVALAAFFIMPENVSAQFFRRMYDESRSNTTYGAKSQLPNPTGAISARNYGPTPTVPEEIRAEVSGSIPPRPVPDFHANPDAVPDYKDVPKLQRTMMPNWYKGGTPVTPPRIKPLSFDPDTEN